jgi:hypothetical protein
MRPWLWLHPAPWWPRAWRERRAILDAVLALHDKVDTLMTTETDLKTELDQIQGAVTVVLEKLQAQADQIANLNAQIGMGVPVTQDQLDQLGAEAAAIVASLGTFVPAAVSPATTPPADAPPADQPPPVGTGTSGDGTTPPTA